MTPPHPPSHPPTRRSPRTILLPGAVGNLEILTIGQGPPSTLFAHGLASSIEATRPFASRVAGRRTFVHLRGHGRSTAPAAAGGWSYEALALDVAVVADHAEATRAFGISMGAGALCALLSVSPRRFQRVVLALPAAIDETVARDATFEMMASAWERGDSAALAEVLIATLPEEERPSSSVWAAREARRLLATPGMGAALRMVPGLAPVTDRAAMGRVTAEVLVIGQEGDGAHPARIARELAECFPHGRSVILPPGGILHRHRARVREMVRDALS